MRFENSDNLIFDNMKDFNEHKKKMKSSQPRFAIFDEKRKAELWLSGDLKTPVRPKRPELSVFRSQGPNESPLRKPKEIAAKDFVGELKSPFKAPDQPLLNKIVAEIRTKRDSAYNFVIEELMKNPRLLISKADTPVPYHAGSWANLVHICCQYDAGNILNAIFSFLEDHKYLTKHYPDVAKELLDEYSKRIVKLYLVQKLCGPRQTITRGDTPLHIAVRNKSLKAIRYFKKRKEWETLREMKNNENKTVEDLLPKDEALNSKELEDLLLEKPVCLAIIQSDYSAPKIMTTSSLTKEQLMNSPNVRAVAGPISSAKACSIVQSATPKRRMNMRFVQSEKQRRIRVTDYEKGLEKITRPFCVKEGTRLLEKWPFLDDFVDITSEGGLQKIEDYLKSGKSSSSCEQDLDSTIDMLCSNFTGLQLEEDENLFMMGDKPSKTDRDVFEALKQISISKDVIRAKLKLFKSVTSWYNRIESYPNEEREKWKMTSKTRLQTRSNGDTPVAFRNPKTSELPVTDTVRKKLFFD